MSKSHLSRRTFMKLAASAGVWLGSAGLTSQTHAQGGSLDATWDRSEMKQQRKLCLQRSKPLQLSNISPSTSWQPRELLRWLPLMNWT